MTYTKQTWADGDLTKPLSAARLSHIEDGLELAADEAPLTLAPPEDPTNANITLTSEANPLVNALQLGLDGPGILKDQHISSGDQTGTGQAAGITLNPGTSNGADQAGAPLRLASGISTGNSGSGSVVVLTATAGISGTQQQIQSDAWYFWGADLAKAITPASDSLQDVGYPTLRVRTVFANGVSLRETSNGRMGAATLSSGTVVVSNTSITANTRIFLTGQNNSVTGALRVSARSVGTSFTITSSNAGDSGVVAYMLVEPT